MFLAIDAGNSSLKLGLYKGDDLTSLRTVAYEDLNAGMLEDLNFKHAAISSVVPQKTLLCENIIKSAFGITPYRISLASRLDLIIDYLTPDTLGIDRICSCIGALNIADIDTLLSGERACIITIDLGTATTVNLVRILRRNESAEPHFAGGLICPGIYTMLSSLHKDTAQLPMTRPEDYRGLFGRDTSSSIASGVITATVGMIEKVLSVLKNEYAEGSTRLFLTGGNASVRQYFSFRHDYVPDLVLRGVKRIYEMNS
ncbi:MAG: type III pantothenate kinase [Bacteroidota bacterium]